MYMVCKCAEAWGQLYLRSQPPYWPRAPLLISKAGWLTSEPQESAYLCLLVLELQTHTTMPSFSSIPGTELQSSCLQGKQFIKLSHHSSIHFQSDSCTPLLHACYAVEHFPCHAHTQVFGVCIWVLVICLVWQPSHCPLYPHPYTSIPQTTALGSGIWNGGLVTASLKDWHELCRWGF